jgi:hypothetical protein
LDGGPGSGRTVGVRRPSAVGAAATRARQPVVSPSLTRCLHMDDNVSELHVTGRSIPSRTRTVSDSVGANGDLGTRKQL